MANQPPTPMVTFPVRYPPETLERLLEIEDLTHVTGREWCRALLAGLIERFDSKGSLELPLAVVSRSEAVKAGILEPQQSG
jgi:hypothetical protein